jgi:predicted SAM-dependent methyltransferase
MKLNIGAGFTYQEGFTNIDICKDYLFWWFPFKKLLYLLSGTRKHHPFIVFEQVLNSRPIRYDIRKPLPFANNTIEEIYTSHVLEHLTEEDGIRFLLECERVLMAGGTLRIVTPDFDIVDKSVLFNDFSDEWSRHKWVWSFAEILRLFPNAKKLSQFMGRSTACSLDSMPEQSMYIEITWR